MSQPQPISAGERISSFDPQNLYRSSQNSPEIADGVYVCIHGHFYQPPREDPSRGVVSKQPSAAPFHDWNERILYESYRPNAFARILNGAGEVVRIVNNYEYISFNIGPTLMSWLERHDLETYRRILAADKISCDRNQGHGNAIAQAYNHIILPLANYRDKVTQIRWGIADFQHRFRRDPEGMWLAETAVDNDTLAVLVNEGIRFIILAPSQASRCRRFGLPHGYDEWQSVEAGDIDPTQPYRCFIPTQPNGRNYIDIFFYDGPISGDMGFDDTLQSSQQFADRLEQAVRSFESENESLDWIASERFRRRSQLISVATDGETFGHHRGGAEKTLAHTVINELPARDRQIISYAHYLSLCPPTWEVQLKPVTAWSCSHGVDRWQHECGCGGGGHWQQQWRAPLRQALDWLRDHLIVIYEKLGTALLSNPWAARNDYINVLNRSSEQALEQFFVSHQTHPLTRGERTEALRLLEMQRHAMLMYTSCGWFFDEISRPEGTQILRYAARAIELAEAVSGKLLEGEFVEQLAQAPSNVDYFKTGAGVYQKQVKPSQTSLERIVAHYAISSLFNSFRPEEQLYCYTLRRQDYYQQPLGALTLAVGRVEVTTAMTQETQILSFAVLHLGGWDFQCGIQAFPNRGHYTQAKKVVTEAFSTASIAQSILAIDKQFSQTYTLKDLSQEERQQIMQQLNQETLQRLDKLYEQVYRENYSVLMAFHRDCIAVPQSLQVAADITLSQRALAVIRTLEQDITEPNGDLLKITVGRVAELEGIAIEAHHFCTRLKIPDAKPVLERLIYQGLSQTLQVANLEQYIELEAAIEGIERLIKLGQKLDLGLALYRVQELYYDYLNQYESDVIATNQPASTHQTSSHRTLLVRLGWALALDTNAVLASD
ncbi:glycosyl hydrolase, family 57 [Synechococcus sp. PCC 7335]|uniref:DUF3536 domain-containing protein n=1 Tax=Synechococcus sp. (strain ATCC 29403 / PCC 7335) TaxID=91464 RepID=UPI00017EDC86|nr:DUF3536 domain-containing protein [Synechococcus sp. PCC 7335]EDX87832.1 glycosyl hydrolase, family 57 [Synechococcus sp. PCC 7335]